MNQHLCREVFGVPLLNFENTTDLNVLYHNPLSIRNNVHRSFAVLQKETQDHALSRLNKAFEVLPESEKSAYLRAKYLCPDLVARESSPLIYLSCQKWNALSAARRLAAYWTQRETLLGRSAYLPLDTRSETDVHFKGIAAADTSLSCEDCFCQLSATDDAGRRIFHYDASFKSSGKNLSTRKAFLLLSTCVENLYSPEIVLMVHADRRTNDDVLLPVVDPILQDLICYAMPWALRVIHVICFTNSIETSPLSTSDLQILPALQQCLVLHTVTTKEEIAKRLSSCGMSLASIPVQFGGSYALSQPNTNCGRVMEHNRTLPMDLNCQKISTQHSTQDGFSSSTQVVSPSAETSQSKLEELQFALNHLPNDNKEAYLKAMEVAPELVLSESDPKFFLERENEDTWAAAIRLAAYWQQRKEIFGDRAFLPLNVSDPAGAFHTSDIQAMASGFLVPLPQSSQGLNVFCFDRSRFSGSAVNLRATLLRSLYYWCHQVVHDEDARKTGVIAVGIIRNLEGINERIDAQDAIDLIQNVFPIKICSFHLFVVSATQEDLTILKKTVVPAIMLRLRSYSSIQCHIHTERVTNLDQFGLQVPQIIGGTWMYESFDIWFCAQQNNARARSIEVKTNVFNGGHAVEKVGSTLFGSRQFHGNEEVHADQTIFHDASVTTILHDDEKGFTETASMQLEGLRRLEEAIQLLPDEDKASYIAAKQCAPHLVQIESNPLRYLRLDKYNAWAAARRLASYWMSRVDVFGDRAFLPLTLSGDGALNQEDISSFYSGYISFLPNDHEGRSVMCYDPQIRRNDSSGARLRIAFYAWSVVNENENGWVCIIPLGSPRFGVSTLDRTVTVGLDVVMQLFSMPSKIHLVNSPTGFGQRFFSDIILPIATRFMERLLRDRTVVHVGSKQQLLQKLGSFGLEASSIPVSIGGQFSNQHHISWIQERLKHESGRYNLIAQSVHDNYYHGNHASPFSRFPENHAHQVTDAVKVPIVSDKVTSGEARTSLTCETIQASVCDVLDVINTIPANKKNAYLQALERAPEVVKKESDPATFLRQENFDAVAAARRLVKYWEVRSAIFQSRAFLPLDQTGEGALDRKDLFVLGTAFLVFLGIDKEKRAVLFCDGTRLSRSSRQSRLRASFYMYSIASENKLSQSAGLILLYITTEPSFDRANKECLDLVLSAVPASICDVHLLQYSAKTMDKPTSDEKDSSILQQFRQVAKNRVVSHLVHSKASFAKVLEPYGFDIKNLPKSIGGDFGYDKFIQWQELRTRYEWNLPAGVSNKQTANTCDFSTVTPMHNMTEEERLERKRRLNVVHSRRKRERERIEIDVLNEQCEEESERKKHLTQDNQRLSALVLKAQTIINNCAVQG